MTRDHSWRKKCIIFFLVSKNTPNPSRNICIIFITISIQTSSYPQKPSFDTISMGQLYSTPPPGPQPEQAHQSSSQLENLSSAPQRPFDQPSSIGHTVSAMPSSPPLSNHPVGPIHPTPSSLPPLYPPSQFRGEIAILSIQAKEMLAAKRAQKAKRRQRHRIKRIERLEQS